MCTPCTPQDEHDYSFEGCEEWCSEEHCESTCKCKGCAHCHNQAPSAQPPARPHTARHVAPRAGLTTHMCAVCLVWRRRRRRRSARQRTARTTATPRASPGARRPPTTVRTALAPEARTSTLTLCVRRGRHTPVADLCTGAHIAEARGWLCTGPFCKCKACELCASSCLSWCATDADCASEACSGCPHCLHHLEPAEGTCRPRPTPDTTRACTHPVPLAVP